VIVLAGCGGNGGREIHGCTIKPQSDLSDEDLSGAHLSGSNFTDTNLDGANLKGANLSNAQIVNASVNQADLIRTNFRGATIENTELDGAITAERSARTARRITSTARSRARADQRTRKEIML